jgi:hypothetical protein
LYLLVEFHGTAASVTERINVPSQRKWLANIEIMDGKSEQAVYYLQQFRANLMTLE